MRMRAIRISPALAALAWALIGAGQAQAVPGPEQATAGAGVSKAGLTVAAGATSAARAGRAGRFRLKLNPRATKTLARQRVKIIGSNGRATRRRARVDVLSGDVGTIARVRLRSPIKLVSRRGKRRVALLRAPLTVLSQETSFADASFAGTRYTMLRFGSMSPEAYDPTTGEVRVKSTKVKLAGSLRRKLQKRLRVRRLPRNIGRVRIAADLEPVPSSLAEPPVLERPEGAVDVTSAELTWRARESFVDYLHAAGDQGGTTTSNGAVDGPAEVIPPGHDARVYQFDFPFTEGWRDPVDGVTRLQMGGTVNFHKLIAPFNIDLDASDPEIELNGEDSRLIARLNGRRGNADQQDRRAVAVDLDLDAAGPPTVTEGDDGTTWSWDEIPATVPEGPTSWPLAGYYLPGDDWGWVKLEYTVNAPEVP